jgi:glucokinase
MAELAIGLDLGGTNIKGGLVDKERGIICQEEVKTEASRGPAHVVDRLTAVGRRLRARAESAPLAVGIGSPGVISWNRREVHGPPNFPGWHVVELAREMEERLGLPAIVENDANLAGLGSAFYGAGKAFDSFIMVTLGTGVGGAIIYNKRIFRGSTGGAGEIGHISIDYEGPYARSGVAGAVEAYLGQQFLTHHARYMLLNRDSVLHEMTGQDLSGLTPRLLHEAASRGDEAAVDMLAWAGHKLGCALGSVINVLDIRKVVVGGGISNVGEFLLDPARAALRRFVLPGMRDGVEIVRETLANDAALLGAARLAFYHARELSAAGER